MHFALGTTIILFLACMMNTQATDTGEDSVVFKSILILKGDNESLFNDVSNISMDIRKGNYPNISSGNEQVKVGDPITILIYLSNQRNLDIVVTECWAYNEEHHKNSTIHLKVTNKTSDFQKSLLTNQLEKKLDLQHHNITMLLYTNLKSFKLTKKESVYIACSVETCYGPCNETKTRKQFAAKLTTTLSAENQLPPLSRNNIKLFINKLNPPSSLSSQKPVFIENSSTDCYPGSQNPKCNTSIPSTCYPGSQEAGCNSSLQPPNCYPGSQNPQCISNNLGNCQPGSQNRKCNFTTPPTCYPGSQNPTCNLNQLNFSNSPPNCYPSSQDPRCNSTPPLNCYPGSQNPRCSLILPPICYPGSQNILCKSIPSCSPNSLSQACRNRIELPSRFTISNSNPSYISSTPTYVLHDQPTLCFSNILRAKCQYLRKKRSGNTQSTTSQHSTIENTSTRSKFDYNIGIQPKLTLSPNCSSTSEHSLDPRCSGNILPKSTTQSSVPVRKCSLQMFNRRCMLETSTDQKLSYNPLLPPNCYPGSKDPRCIQLVSKEPEVFIDDVAYNPLKPPNCYPGSKDPRCSKY